MRISYGSSYVCSSDLPRLDHHARAIAIRRLDDAILDALEQARLVEQRHDALARREPVEADQVGGDEAVGGLRDLGRGIEHVEHLGRLEPGALADLEEIGRASGRERVCPYV